MPPTVLSYVREVRTNLPRRIVDGDTWWAYVDLGYRQLGFFEYRLLGWDTPEKQGPETTPFEREQGKLATQVAIDWWSDEIRVTGGRILVQSEPDPERYGRWLGTLWSETPSGTRRYLADHLASLNLAVPSKGTKGTRWRDTYDQRP